MLPTPRRPILRRLATTLAVAALTLSLTPSAATASPARYTNPLVEKRADAHISRHTDGYYYFTASVPEYDRVVLRRATTLQGLTTAPETVIWRKNSSGELSANVWAPELHSIGGKWYAYFAAGRADEPFRIRMYVMESSSANPLTGTWSAPTRITTAWDTFALDATTFEAGGVRYLAWAQSEPGIATNSNLYIARMAGPKAISGTPVRIAVPTRDWETRGFKVNEGPAVIQRNGRIFLTFSASATDANYCLGLLTASASSNLLDPASWVKSPDPVFTSNAATSQYGPGHNSFTTSEDGRNDVLVYHDRSYRDIVGDPLYDPNRRTRVQKLYWNADGTPNFGIPVADGPTPVRLQSYNYPDRYVRHWEFKARVEANVTNLADSQFRVVTGLAGGGSVSLESTNFPGYYLRHRNHVLHVEKNDGTATFRGDASFQQRAGLADGSAVSFESTNAPGRYVRHTGVDVLLQPVSDAVGRADATWVLQ
ncbi:family 43 glycosylhydrolase [Umezawaea sp.]|uniref:family 43 glycosylhydrolase n=1 Tax=Umezawaea sp. TaxID=1955258 RepID=UPI002ED68297